MTGHAILVVDDDDAVRLSLREYLADRGFNVLVASDGVSAIKHLIDNEVSAIVTDYRMEVLGGDSWVRFLQRFCADTPVFIISGYLPPNVEVPYPIIPKPFDFEELADRLAREVGINDR
jgi:DNA-binding NtrC family response regulator